jgi:hypothetical protein
MIRIHHTTSRLRLGLRQPSAALVIQGNRAESARGLAQSKKLARIEPDYLRPL